MDVDDLLLVVFITFFPSGAFPYPRTKAARASARYFLRDTTGYRSLNACHRPVILHCHIFFKCSFVFWLVLPVLSGSESYCVLVASCFQFPVPGIPNAHVESPKPFMLAVCTPICRIERCHGTSVPAPRLQLVFWSRCCVGTRYGRR